MIERKCGRCRKERPAGSFVDASGVERKACQVCRDYARENNRKHRRAPGAEQRQRRRNLWDLYRITPEEYDSRRRAQAYACDICRTPEAEVIVGGRGRPRKDGTPSAEPFRLVVDHDHATGAVRGLLCHRCNTAIGVFRDNRVTLLRAIRYLEGMTPFVTSEDLEAEERLGA